MTVSFLDCELLENRNYNGCCISAGISTCTFIGNLILEWISSGTRLVFFSYLVNVLGLEKEWYSWSKSLGQVEASFYLYVSYQITHLLTETPCLCQHPGLFSSFLPILIFSSIPHLTPGPVIPKLFLTPFYVATALGIGSLFLG